MKSTPAVVQLASEEEGVEEMAALSSETLLLRWVNYHLKAANHPQKVSNFSSDIKDGEVYTILLHQIAPEICNLSPLKLNGLSRAFKITEEAAKIGCDCYVTAGDIVGGAPNLNLAFVANLFLKRWAGEGGRGGAGRGRVESGVRGEAGKL